MIRNKKGFTLVELIIVMAIIAVLAVIVIPLIGGQVETSRVAHDRATLRTVQGAVAMYFAQNGSWPAATDYAALATPLAPFLRLEGTPPAMPLARSAGRSFGYTQGTGTVTITPALPTP